MKIEGNRTVKNVSDALGRLSQVGQITGGSAITDVIAKNATSLDIPPSMTTLFRGKLITKS